MILNVVDYQLQKSNSGSVYSATLRFFLEDGEPKSQLYADYLETLRTGSPTSKPVSAGVNPTVIPGGNSPWSGDIAGDTYDPANTDSVLTQIDYGDYGYQDGRCYRDVNLQWTPIEFAGGGVSTAPPGNNTSNDPSQWFPEFDRTTKTIQVLRPQKFLGYLDRADIPFGPLHEDNVDLQSAGPGDTLAKGDTILPVNSAGQALDPLLLSDVVTYLDTFVEYRTYYADPGTALETRQNVVNSVELIIDVETGGFDAVTGAPAGNAIRVQYPKGTARLESINLRSAVYRYVSAGVVNYVPYVVKRTQIAVSGFGWAEMIMNTGHMYVDSGVYRNIRTEEGPVVRPVTLARGGIPAAAGTFPGAMCYGNNSSTFTAFLGSTFTGTDPITIKVT